MLTLRTMCVCVCARAHACVRVCACASYTYLLNIYVNCVYLVIIIYIITCHWEALRAHFEMRRSISFFFIIISPRGLTFTWWGCCSLCFWHKPAELAHSSLFCSCVCLSLSPFPLYFIPYILPTTLCFLTFSDLIFALLVLSTIYLFRKVSISPDIILCGWLGWKHQLTS